ncbi:MAG TPA: hypothetical protein VNS60_14125 [Solirubrobacterales bacterium]|nr:hypothetical protein [Solirubrobacterales bacterium]
MGIAVGVLVAWLACDSAVRDRGVTLTIATGAVGVAIISAVLTALAVIAALFDGPYRRVLIDDAGGIREAMAPYMVVASVAGLSVIAALVVAVGWPEFSPALKMGGLGVSTALAAWSVAGTVSLIELTIFHAEQRATLMGKQEDTHQRASGSVR